MKKAMKILPRALAASLLTIVAAPALAAGNADDGARVFRQCRGCHALKKKVIRMGPPLAGVVGRPVASVEGYHYSDAMKAYGAGGKVWSEDRLATFLANPVKTVPGTKMYFPGLSNASQIADVIAYLKTQGGGK